MTISATTATNSAAATAANASTASSASSGAGGNALSQLSGNFNDFLNLLMTQLKNQDPSSPMDATTFTTQLVQFSSVEQQINTNSNLQTLIQATQSNTMLQSSALVGKQVTATNDHLSLQNGSASIHFTAPSAETVNIAITAADGSKVLQTTMSAQAGNNDWTWDGTTSKGTTANDGSYKVTVFDPSQTALATTVTGTVTGVERSGSSVNVSMGALATDISTVQSTSAN